MRVIMSAIIDQARRNSNVDEADGVNRRHRMLAPARSRGRQEEVRPGRSNHSPGYRITVPRLVRHLRPIGARLPNEGMLK